MALTQAIETPDELRLLEQKAIEKRDRFVLGAIQGHKALPSRSTKARLGSQSLFSFLSPLWRSMNDTQKQVWADAGVYSGLSGWQLFISDNAARLRHELPLEVPPSELWQVRAGRILLEAPASEILLKQEHPQEYWTAGKVRGQSWKNELVLVKEEFSLPLELQIRYKSNLTAVGGTQKAQYLARVWTSYQGEDTFYDFVIPLSPNVDWTYAEVTSGNIRGYVIGYTLYIDIAGYQGEILYDNIRAIHGGTNWARDPRCDEIDKTFKKAFAIVPPFWVPVSLPAGASFSSQYPPAL